MCSKEAGLRPRSFLVAGSIVTTNLKIWIPPKVMEECHTPSFEGIGYCFFAFASASQIKPQV